jgi:hypothetical protein
MIQAILMKGEKKWNEKECERVLAEHPQWDKELDENEYTAFMTACLYRQENLALAMMDTGKARVDYITPTHNISSFYWACLCGVPDVALRLIDMGLPVNIKTNTGKNAFDLLNAEKRPDEDIDDYQQYHGELEPVMERLETGKITIRVRRVVPKKCPK